jgi:hypothetical protein
MVANRVKAVAESLYSVHSDLLSVSISGKDCERFAAVLVRIGRLQSALMEVSDELLVNEADIKEVPDVGNS